MGSDGAPVMLGDRGGVFALLKQEIPHLIKVHCIAHRLELAFADILLAVPEFKDIKYASGYLETISLLTKSCARN